jgi:hypothetical protein
MFPSQKKTKGKKGSRLYLLCFANNLAKAKQFYAHVAGFRALVWTLSYEDSYKLVEAPYLGMGIKVLLPMETDLRMAIVAEI